MCEDIGASMVLLYLHTSISVLNICLVTLEKRRMSEHTVKEDKWCYSGCLYHSNDTSIYRRGHPPSSMRGWMTWWNREGHWKGRRRITSGKKEQHVWYSPPMTGAHINGNETPQWSKTIRNVTRRGSTESLMEDRLQLGTNK